MVSYFAFIELIFIFFVIKLYFSFWFYIVFLNVPFIQRDNY